MHLSFIMAATSWPTECFIGVYDNSLGHAKTLGKAELNICENGAIQLVVPRACLPENGGKIYLMRSSVPQNPGTDYKFGIFHSLRIAPMPHEIGYFGRLSNYIASICAKDDLNLPFERDSRTERIALRAPQGTTLAAK